MEILGGTHGRMRASKKQIQQVINGGRRADLIRKAANEHHTTIDIPDAEMFLEQALKEEQYKEEKNTLSSQPVPASPLSFWEQAKKFWNDGIKR